MRTVLTLPIACALTWGLLLAGCDATSPDASAEGTGNRYGDIVFNPCSLDTAGTGRSISAQCAKFTVAEDRQRPDGREIALNVAWLPVENGGAIDDPVFFLAGGPGQAATEHAVAVDAMLAEVRKQRDIILVDQRGTGGSNPLECGDVDEAAMEAQVAELGIEQATVRFARECAGALRDQADPRFYTTAQAVADLEAVRAALGVDKINLVGVSYGTRVAQQYAARHPEHVRSLVLDGVVPNDLVVGGEFARTFEQSLVLQAARCSELPACEARFGTDVRARLREVVATLEAAPVEVEYRDPTTNAIRQGTATADTVTGLVFAFSYMPQTAALLPLVLDQAAQGHYGPLMSLSRLTSENMAGGMARGMQWSVVCAEDADRVQPDAAAADTILGASLSDMFFAACQVWPTGERSVDFTAPLDSSVPALLLSGEIDPVTPPSYGERVLESLPGGRHLVLQGQGHNVLGAGCMPKLVGQFIESADAASLDVECLDALKYVPPFTSFNGWEP